jgi:hypothetical protein
MLVGRCTLGGWRVLRLVYTLMFHDCWNTLTIWDQDGWMAGVFLFGMYLNFHSQGTFRGDSRLKVSGTLKHRHYSVSAYQDWL